MKLDRTIQKEILLKLAETYHHPNGENLVHYIKNKREYTGFNEYPYDYIVANLFYLQEHQLVDGFSIKYALGGTSIENFYQIMCRKTPSFRAGRMSKCKINKQRCGFFT
ncbi:Uncharacterised protein [Avibacterium paragallinarum]|uniref:Uncharacterized protein n=1 Tax=Avibacterium paragallinarum TaxID=728 RepID=A0A377I7K7_AVIPA|nr:hypothetical protein [Avibacterium paragallinarum]STO71307.1 Uncharacterised protein [Avibacterium paragallinarum]